MLRIAVLVGIALVSATPATAAEASAEAETYWTLEQLAEGVYAALQPSDRRFNDANVVVIVNAEDVVVVDAPADCDRVRELIRRIGELSDKPVRFVVNTHWHADHVQGNAVYRDAWGGGVTFVGHETLLEDVPSRAAPDVLGRIERLTTRIPEAEARLDGGTHEDGRPITEEEASQQRAAIERAKAWLERNRGARFIAPDLTYADRMTLQRGERRIELHHVRAHTRGDTVIYLPKEKVLITGDMLDDLPYVGHGYPEEWLAALDAVSAFEFDVIVPGHGPVFHGREQLENVRGFMQALVSGVRELARQGRTEEEIRTAIDLSRWRETLARDDAATRFFDQVLPEAIARAHASVTGTLAD